MINFPAQRISLDTLEIMIDIWKKSKNYKFREERIPQSLLTVQTLIAMEAISKYPQALRTLRLELLSLRSLD